MDAWDPCTSLPPEVLEILWFKLEERELLACRGVSASWKELLEDSSVWRRYLRDDPTDPGSPWERYLGLGKRAAAWSRGRFQLNSIGLSQHQLKPDKIVVGRRYVYVMGEKSVSFFNKTLEKVEQEHVLEDGFSGVSLKGSGDTLGVLTCDKDSKYRLEVLASEEVVLRERTCSRAFAVGSTGSVTYLRASSLVMWSAQGTILLETPGPVRDIGETDIHLAVLTVHPVRRGAGFSVHRRSKTREGDWDEVYTAENRSALAVIEGALFSSPEALLVTERHSTEHADCTSHIFFGEKTFVRQELKPTGEVGNSAWLCHRHLARWDKGFLYLLDSVPWSPVECPIRPCTVLSRSSAEVIAVCTDGSLHYIRAGRKLYILQFPFPIVGAKIGEDCITLWNKEALYTLTLRELQDEPFTPQGFSIVDMFSTHHEKEIS